LFHKGRELYGLYEARQALRHIDKLVVVEGYMDVVALARHGIDFSIATLGTATTGDHLNVLFRLTDNVFFCFDGDRAGKAAAWRALENTLPQIREGRQVRFVFLPEGHDPDSYVNEFGSDAFEKSLDQGMALSDFLINELGSARPSRRALRRHHELRPAGRPQSAVAARRLYGGQLRYCSTTRQPVTSSISKNWPA
jgi:DNA primase